MISLLFYVKPSSVMRIPKPVLLFCLLVLSAFNVQTSKTYLTKWVINKECTLKVVGSTNVNTFSCVIPHYFKPDILTFNDNNTHGAIKMTGALKLDIQEFDCHNTLMTSDLRKTLKCKKFPYLIITFISLNRYPYLKKETDNIKGIVSIQLAGNTKRYEVDFKFKPTGTNTLTLVGLRKVNFSDFDIVPPRKLGGMIKTNNELEVEFNLEFKILNEKNIT